MSWWEPWPSLSAPAARGVVVAMWVDGHLLRLGPASEASGDPLAGEPPGAPLQPALRSALRLLGLAATSAGVDAAALLPCCGLLAPRALGAVAPAALTPGLPSGAGLRYLRVDERAPLAAGAGLLAVLAGRPRAVLARCGAYLAMHGEQVALSAAARAEIEWWAGRMARANLLVFALAYAAPVGGAPVGGAPVGGAPADAASTPLTLAALVAVRCCDDGTAGEPAPPAWPA